MKILRSLLGFILIASIAFACNTGIKHAEKVEVQLPGVENPSLAMAKFIEGNGDYLNAKGSPYLTSNSEVYAHQKDYLILDIRDFYDYMDGHINGALFMELPELFNYLNVHGSGQYEKVIIVDNTGLHASYVASVLRAAGYGNVYPLKEGMASWNKVFTHFWTDEISSKYSSSMTSEESKMPEKGAMPKLEMEAKDVASMIRERAKLVIEDYPIISVDELKEAESEYFVINYWPKAKYDIAHWPGAVDFPPKQSLKLEANLQNIPADKKIAVYCYTGQTAAAAVGYLRVLGYDAYAINIGVNSFMYNTAKANGWHAYNAAEKVKNYTIVTGEEASNEEIAIAPTNNSGPAAPVIQRKKKEESGGGCD